MFFVDEIHRLPRALEETFYPAMEDRQLPITVGQGAGARVVTLDLPPFTLDRRHHARRACSPRRCATASASRHRLDLYGPEDLARIVAPLGRHPRAWRSTQAGAAAIAARSRGTPRVANRLLKRVRDFAEVRGAGHIDAAGGGARRSTCSRWTRRASTGSTARSCDAICEKFDGGPVGLSTLAVAVGEEPDTIEDVYEPYLLQQGLLKRTPRGRVATRGAPTAHLGPRAAPADAAQSLF